MARLRVLSRRRRGTARPALGWQPDGVHGRRVSSTTRSSTGRLTTGADESCLGRLVYELHVGTFTPEGTFDGRDRALDHLVELGVTHVELMPVAAFPGRRGWGYDGVDLFAPHDSYGGPDGLKRLVDACHARGPRRDPRRRLQPPRARRQLPAARSARTSPTATARPGATRVNFDGPGSDEVRRFFVDNALMWLRDYHVDGLRLDAVHAIVDTSAVHLLEELAVEVARAGGAARAAARPDRRERPERPAAGHAAGGRRLRPRRPVERRLPPRAARRAHRRAQRLLRGLRHRWASWRTALTGGVRLRRAATRRIAVASTAGRRPASTAASDSWATARTTTRSATAPRATACRHAGARPSSRVAAALVLTAPFMPMLFMGEEWAATTPFQYFTDHDDPELAEAVREGRRREFAAFGLEAEEVPDPQDPATFERSTLDWAELGASRTPMLAWYRELIALRRSRLDLATAALIQFEVDFDEDERWLGVRRRVPPSSR